MVTPRMVRATEKAICTQEVFPGEAGISTVLAYVPPIRSSNFSFVPALEVTVDSAGATARSATGARKAITS